MELYHKISRLDQQRHTWHWSGERFDGTAEINLNYSPCKAVRASQLWATEDADSNKKTAETQQPEPKPGGDAHASRQSRFLLCHLKPPFFTAGFLIHCSGLRRS